MAAKTTTQAGPFTTGSTWVGGVAPSSGDTVTINHAVTWTPGAGSFMLGTGTGTAVTIGSAGSLALTPTGAFTLTLAGTWSGTNTTAYELVASATSATLAIVFDATAAGAGFQILTAGAYDTGSTPRGWNLVGNATRRISVSSLPSDGTKNSYFGPTAQNGGGVVQAAYVDFTRIGDATNSMFAPNWGNSRSWNLSLSNCTFTSCGQYTVSVDSSYSSTFAFTDCTWASSVTNGSTSFPVSLSSLTTGAVTFTRCVWDQAIKLTNVKNVSWPNCYFNNGWAGTAVTIPWTSMTGCFIRQTTDDLICPGSVTDSFLFYDLPAGSNPHWLSLPASIAAGSTIDWSRNAIYFNGTDAAGNIYLTACSTAVTHNIKNNLALPNAGGSMSGALVTSNNAVGAGFQLNIEHNTLFVKGQHGLEIGHGYTTVESPSRYASVRSNLFIGGGTGYKAYNVDGTTSQDLLTPSLTDYNAGYQTVATSGVANFVNEGRGYAGKFSSTPGVHDVDGQNPNFVNGSASLTTWAVTQGGSTEADALTYIKAAPATKVPALLAYLAAAYSPTNTALKATAHDGGDIGAFSVTVLGTVPYQSNLMSGNFSSMGF